MDRQIVYPGQILPETSLLQMTKDSMIGMAKLASALLGTSTYASGFAVSPTGPASLQVLCAPGEIYRLTTIDALAFSTLPADTTHSILKQGILLDGVTLNCPAPGTTGQSINYLVQVTYQDSDSTPVLLPYYNSENPAMPYSGMGNNGLTQNTNRKGIAVVAVKAGASAVTGSQVTPAPDAGYIGLYVVTVAFGQTTITSGNISVAASAPLINSTLHGLSPVFSVPPVVPPATLPAHAAQFGQIPAHGQCRLAKSGANLVLSPYNGNKLIIGGVMQSIPGAGVSLAPTGLTPSTLYYIYAYMNAGVMTLEASATGHSADATTGIEIKTGDATRTLVGMVRPITGPAFVDSSAQRFVLSWFNRVGKDSSVQQTAIASTSSALNVVLAASLTCEFLTWGDEVVQCSAEGAIRVSTNTATVTTVLTFDGFISGETFSSIGYQASVANFDCPATLNAFKTGLSEGYHTSTVLGNTTAGTAAWGTSRFWYNRALIRG